MKTCLGCFCEFEPIRSNSRYCSNKCYNKKFREAHKKDAAEYLREYRKTYVPGERRANWLAKNKDRVRDIKRRYYLKHKKIVVARSIEYAQENPEKVERYKKRYAATEKGRISGYNGVRRRLARKANAEGNFTYQEFAELCARYGNCCLRCRKVFDQCDLSADHVVPLARGGSDDISNIQPLCIPCNSRKHAKTIDYRPSFNANELSQESS